MVQIFKRGDTEHPRRRREEASASCQKLTGTQLLPASPSLFQTAPAGDRAGRWEARPPVTSEGNIAPEPSRVLLNPSVPRLLQHWVWGCQSCLGAGVRAVPRGEGVQGMAQRGTDPRAPFHPRGRLSCRPERGTNPDGDHGQLRSLDPGPSSLCLGFLSPHPGRRAPMSLPQTVSKL